MTRMSSPDGSEILTVDNEVGASVLASLGWSTEGGSRRSGPNQPQRQPEVASEGDSTESSSGEAPRKRGPGRPRKHPVEGE